MSWTVCEVYTWRFRHIQFTLFPRFMHHHQCTSVHTPDTYIQYMNWGGRGQAFTCRSDSLFGSRSEARDGFQCQWFGDLRPQAVFAALQWHPKKERTHKYYIYIYIYIYIPSFSWFPLPCTPISILIFWPLFCLFCFPSISMPSTITNDARDITQ